MKSRRTQGATLGLVAVSVLVVILIGVGFYFLSKMFGGGREVANATDAGILNAAKMALRKGQTNLAASPDEQSFAGCSDTTMGDAPGQISMLTLNRVIAQAVFIGLNAGDEGTAAASANAATAINTAKAISGRIRAALVSSALDGDFDSIAGAAKNQMWGGAANRTGSLTQSYMKRRGSTNVYWDTSILSAGQAAIITSKLNPTSYKVSLGASATADPAGPKIAGLRYMQGYEPITITGGTIYGTPVFPQTTPHLVAGGDFSAPTSAYIGGSDTPPNAFMAVTSAAEQKSGNIGGSMAAAILGCINNEYLARIPRGYVRVWNGPDANTVNPPVTSPVFDATNDIFANELYSPGITVANNDVFSLNQPGIQAWADYNATRGWTDPDTASPTYGQPSTLPGKGDPAMWPPSISNVHDTVFAGNYVYYDSSGNGISSYMPLLTDDLPGNGCIGNVYHTCHDVDYDVPMVVQKCDDLLTAFNTAYPPPANTTGVNDGGKGFTALEWVKGKVLEGFNAKCTSVPSVQPSGLKVWNHNIAHPMTSATTCNFGTPGSPWDLMQQTNNCGSSTMLGLITNRMKQVDSSINTGDVQTALDSMPLQMYPKADSVLYLYADGAAGPKVKCAATVPWTGTLPASPDMLKPDGLPNAALDQSATNNVANCSSSINAYHRGVDDKKHVNGASTGDANLHDVPYKALYGSVTSVDHCTWTPSSGYRNMLGEVRFFNDVNGSGKFCKPN